MMWENESNWLVSKGMNEVDKAQKDEASVAADATMVTQITHHSAVSLKKFFILKFFVIVHLDKLTGNMVI
jgi:hypothetical protein